MRIVLKCKRCCGHTVWGFCLLYYTTVPQKCVTATRNVFREMQIERDSEISSTFTQPQVSTSYSVFCFKQNPILVISNPCSFMVISCKRESMLCYEAITLIQDVEVHDLSIDLVPVIWVAASNCSYTPPNFVPLSHKNVLIDSQKPLYWGIAAVPNIPLCIQDLQWKPCLLPCFRETRH